VLEFEFFMFDSGDVVVVVVVVLDDDDDDDEEFLLPFDVSQITLSLSLLISTSLSLSYV
jgi:hypothetical protein